MIRRPGFFFAFVAGLALFAAAVEHTVAAVRARLAEPGRGACWIWAPGAVDGGAPLAFQAVRDFEVTAVARSAELAITADESYVVYLNGRRIGSGAYRRAAPADLYDVAADLELGGNRLVVELASSRGTGGLLASLLVAGRPVAVTDSEWRVFRRHEAGILRGWELEGGEPAQVWHRPPTGRWRLSPPAPRPALPVDFPAPVTRRARRARQPFDGSPWLDLDGDRHPLARLGPRAHFDWGEEVTGLLTLELASDTGETGLLYVGSEPCDREPPADALIIPLPGRGSWTDVHPRTFRHACLVGVELNRAPEVLLLAPRIARQLAAPDPRRQGVFGLAAWRRESRAEEDVRRRLTDDAATSSERRR